MKPSTIKLIFSNSDIRKRILAVLAFIILVRLLAHIPVPVANPANLTDFLRSLFNSNRLFGFVDLFSGGAITNFSIILVGLSPYITASVVIQLATQVMPKLKELQKEGEQGRQRINQYTRLLTVPLAIAQSVGTVFVIRRLSVQVSQIDVIGSPSISQWLFIITVLAAGSLLMMWLGELISERGIGNGISLLIAAGIIARLPALAGQVIALVKSDPGRLMPTLGFVAAALVVVYFIVKLNEGQRILKVHYAKRVRGAQAYGGVESTLPIRVLTAGVIPIIFAIAALSLPNFFGQLFTNAKSGWLAHFAHNLTVWFQPQHTVYAIVYFTLVVAFTYFYTNVVFNSDDIAENLQKQGGFIPGIRPGAQTASFLKKIVNRLTLLGAFSLGIIALLPFIAERVTGSTFLTFGGTGILIVISVAIETLRQLESQAVTSTYT